MDLNVVIAQLRREVEELDEAIKALERVEAAQLHREMRSVAKSDAAPKSTSAAGAD
jgi:hypothetical protein